MEIYLKCHWNNGGVRKFDTSTGEVGKKEAAIVQATHWGFIWRQKLKWFAIRRDGNHLVFQHKTRVWPLKEPFKFEISGWFMRKFSISNSSTLEFSIKYRPSGLIHQFFDPTYDAIDAEKDDFFLYICSMREGYGEKGLENFQFEK